MNKVYRVMSPAIFLLLISCLSFVNPANGQVPTPPPNSLSSSGKGSNQSEAAPLGGGLDILLLLGIIYAGKKVYKPKLNANG